MNATITAAPLPTNFKGTPQQWIDALLDRLEVSFEGNSFVIGDIEPEGNEGPWLKNGTQWWVWNDATSQYVPLDVSASITDQIFVGDIANGAPDPNTFQIWLQLNGTTVNGLFYYAGSTAGWVAQASPLNVGTVQLAYLTPQNTGSLITFDANRNPILLPPGSPGTFLVSTGGVPTWGSQSSVHGVPTFIAPVVLVSAIGTVTGGQWNTISTLTAHGIPITASAIILATSMQLQSDVFFTSLLMRPNSSGSVYTLAACNTSGGGAPSLSTFNQGIYPIFVSSGVASFDWSSDTSATFDPASQIVLIGYIT